MLSSIGQPVIAPLLEAFDDNLIETNWATLILTGIESPRAAPDLIKALEHKNADIRSAAARAFGNISDESDMTKDVVSALSYMYCPVLNTRD